ncbi:MAG: Holliday junction resolvase RuvX [Ardenticatenales bacterium]
MIGRTLAVDYGSRRVGLAVCDGLGITTRPLATIDRRVRPDLVAAVVEHVRAEEAVRVLVGIPRLASGDAGAVAAPALALADALRAALGGVVEVLEADEGSTSQEAAARLALGRGGRGWQRGAQRSGDGRPADKGAIDAAAAAVLLEGWLYEQLAGSER